MKIPEFETSEEAKQWLREHFQEGATCPCCTQFVKCYPLKIPGTAVRDLIALYRKTHSGRGYAHVNEFANLASRSFAKLAYWDLIKAEENLDTQKRTSGMWTLTEKGRQFVRDDIKIPKRAYIYNGKRLKYSEDEVSISEAIGHKFNYQELMGLI